MKSGSRATGADLLRIVIRSDPVDPEVDSLADVVLVQPLVGDAQRRQQQEEERARRHSPVGLTIRRVFRGGSLPPITLHVRVLLLLVSN